MTTGAPAGPAGLGVLEGSSFQKGFEQDTCSGRVEEQRGFSKVVFRRAAARWTRAARVAGDRGSKMLTMRSARTVGREQSGIREAGRCCQWRHYRGTEENVGRCGLRMLILSAWGGRGDSYGRRRTGETKGEGSRDGDSDGHCGNCRMQRRGPPWERCRSSVVRQGCTGRGYSMTRTKLGEHSS